MIKYYILSHSSDAKIVGDYPQTEGTEIPDSNGDFREGSRANLSNYEFPSNEPSLNLTLTNKAKLTDFVSPSDISARGVFVNEKTKNILQKFNILNHKFYSGSVKHQGSSHPFYWLHISNDSLSGVDFNNSLFAEYDIIGDIEKSGIYLSSEDDFYVKNRECDDMNTLEVEKLSLTPDFKEYDIFLIPHIHDYIIISVLVLNELEKAGLNGYKIRPADFIIS
ncbi:MAG: hypothetical protein AAF487_13235 [Bacteroidota bacterium]